MTSHPPFAGKCLLLRVGWEISAGCGQRFRVCCEFRIAPQELPGKARRVMLLKMLIGNFGLPIRLTHINLQSAFPATAERMHMEVEIEQNCEAQRALRLAHGTISPFAHRNGGRFADYSSA